MTDAERFYGWHDGELIIQKKGAVYIIWSSFGVWSGAGLITDTKAVHTPCRTTSILVPLITLDCDENRLVRTFERVSARTYVTFTGIH
jgi:hypothetical protein